jgi:hypothetical protein
MAIISTRGRRAEEHLQVYAEYRAGLCHVALGMVTEAMVQLSAFETPSVRPALLSAVAASSVFAAALSLAATFLVSLLPSVSRRVTECQHPNAPAPNARPGPANVGQWTDPTGRELTRP